VPIIAAFNTIIATNINFIAAIITFIIYQVNLLFGSFHLIINHLVFVFYQLLNPYVLIFYHLIFDFLLKLYFDFNLNFNLIYINLMVFLITIHSQHLEIIFH
jgi:hypothetical protein